MKCRNRTPLLFIITVFSCLPVLAISWKDSLEESLSSRYIMSKTSKLGATTVTQPGTVLIAKIDGFTAGMPTKVIDGKIKPPGGLTTALLPKEEKHDFRSGDRFYITKVMLDDDSFKLILISADSADVDRAGTTSQRRWTVALEFEFPKGYLRSADVDKLMPVIEAVIQTEAQAKAVQTKTIQMGQSKVEVESILGKPETIAELGPKSIYSYKAMKIVFVDGKVSDVQ